MFIISHYIHRLVLALAIAVVSMTAMADKNHGKATLPSSLPVHNRTWTEMETRGTAQSIYPVEVAVKGNSLRISSKHRQILPIYTQTGCLYLSMRLNSGVNWLNGLPRGRYRINNRTINIQ